MTIEQSWNRISNWYGRNAPVGDYRLASGANPESIEEVEAALGLAFTQDLRESYLLHNGSNECGVFPYGFSLLPLDGIRLNWQSWKDYHDENGLADFSPTKVNGIRKCWWNVKWIPFSFNSGDHHCVDMDPDSDGCVGQVIDFSHEAGPTSVLASSLSDFLSEFATELEFGKFRYDEHDLTLYPVDNDI